MKEILQLKKMSELDKFMVLYKTFVLKMSIGNSEKKIENVDKVDKYVYNLEKQGIFKKNKCGKLFLKFEKKHLIFFDLCKTTILEKNKVCRIFIKKFHMKS